MTCNCPVPIAQHADRQPLRVEFAILATVTNLSLPIYRYDEALPNVPLPMLTPLSPLA